MRNDTQHRRDDAMTLPNTGVTVPTTAVADDTTPVTASLVTPVLGAKTTEPAGTSDVMTIDETAAFLRVHRKTVCSMIQRGELPGARRCGRTYRVHRPSVVAWLAAGPRASRRGGRP